MPNRDYEPGDTWPFSVPFPGLTAGAANASVISVKATPVFSSNKTTAPKSKYK